MTIFGDVPFEHAGVFDNNLLGVERVERIHRRVESWAKRCKVHTNWTQAV